MSENKKTMQKITAMKTTILTIITLFIFCTNTLLSGNIFIKNSGRTSPPDGTELSLVRPEIITAKIAPTTPKVADFEEPCLQNETNISELVPATPLTADFEEIDLNSTAMVKALSPAPPAVADFVE
jgi:hypothetical protein